MISNRRTFIMTVAATGAAFAATRASAQAAVDPKDATATALGYVAVSAKPDQHCGNCALFQGKATDATGPCPLFAGKVVSTKAWCTAYQKKAA